MDIEEAIHAVARVARGYRITTRPETGTKRLKRMLKSYPNQARTRSDCATRLKPSKAERIPK
ncbi:MAG: hypothetical protein O2857_31345 [Planctomycetota bacterium]|nr:hypothetical protein [Planctomycetota bacterium]